MPRKAGQVLYKIKVHRKVVTEDSKRFDSTTKEKIKRKCKELLSRAPDKVGEPLQFALKGYRKLKIFDEYRIIYRVEKASVLVFILAVGISRDDEVYREALKRL
jgi:addiction module RelE/StbE family toxin